MHILRWFPEITHDGVAGLVFVGELLGFALAVPKGLSVKVGEPRVLNCEKSVLMSELELELELVVDDEGADDDEEDADVVVV